MNRIDSTFRELRRQQRAALIPFLMAGDPNLPTTRRLMDAAAGNGADLLEVGVPFSDPIADGPTLQASIEVALNAGTSLPRVLEMIADFRTASEIPIVLYGYYNPIFRYGAKRFAADARTAGVDAVLIVDLPPEEVGELYGDIRREGMHFIFLLTPTSGPDRVKKVLRRASGFIYYVSLTGVTGSQAISIDAVRQAVTGLREYTKLPIGVGFGISSPDQAGAVSEFADAAVVGTAIMRVVAQVRDDEQRVVADVGAFIGSIRAGMRNGTR
jgi:tryptophan synthase alpha chain